MRKLTFATIFSLISIPYATKWFCVLPDAISKPFVYRQLVPTLNEIIGSQIIVELLFCIALGLLMLWYYERNYETNWANDIATVLAFCAILVVLGSNDVYKKSYDVPTAFFFMLMFVLWEERKYALFLPVFALSCINRETTLLILPIIALIKPKAHIHVFQVIFWLGIMFVTHEVFSEFPGSSAWIRPRENILHHLKYAGETIRFLSIVGFLALLFVRNLHSIKDGAMLFVIFLAPVLFVLYIVLGNPFEFRVFAEVLPILFIGVLLK